MTREEAINYLKRSWAIGEDDDSRYHNEVLEFIIKALEQKQCDDAVSRQAVKELFQEGSVMGMYYFLGIDELPSVTQTRPKGHWIDHSDEGFVECSECGSATNCDGNIADLHFCFSCGAKMEGEE